MSARTIDVNQVYKETHRALNILTNTLELYHDQMLKLMEESKNKDFKILELSKKIQEMQPNVKKVPNKETPSK